jgi:two-component system chemotaxis response regulator CheY
MNGVRILVVDDDRLVRSAMVRTLRRGADVEVEDFAEGEEALSRCAQAAFDVAVLDLKMPVLDGVTLAVRLRERLPKIRLIFVTADPTGELAQRAREMKPTAVLAKPWSPEDLLKLLRP